MLGVASRFNGFTAVALEDRAMEPRDYCAQRVVCLRTSAKARPDLTQAQIVVVAAYYAQREFSERDFVNDLELLAGSAERSDRPGLATAARAVLADWRAKQTEPTDAPSPRG